jgi:hypothetical protein
MSKKKKIINSDPSVNFRIPIELKEQLNREAIIKNQTVSTYLRELLTAFFGGKLFEDELSIYEKQEFINSTEFIQLIVWMYSVRKDSKCNLSDFLFERYISTIKRLDGNLPPILVDEFDKVLEDLLKLKKSKFSSNRFQFCESSSIYNGFDFDKLEKYLLEDQVTVYKVNVK